MEGVTPEVGQQLPTVGVIPDRWIKERGSVYFIFINQVRGRATAKAVR